MVKAVVKRNKKAVKKKVPRKTPMGTALTPESKERECTDFKLRVDKGHKSVWISVNNLSLNIIAQDEGVSVYAYPKGREMDDSLTETWVLYSEAEEVSASPKHNPQPSASVKQK